MTILSSRRTALLLSTVFAAGVMPTLTFAQTSQATINPLDVITVTGTKTSVDDISGSVSFYGPEDLAKQNYSDINRILRTTPGVNVQEEDGYGLRPNIGLRGSGSDRSGKVLIMEDGVLMAPAPYSAPSAYYFPMSGRMRAVEVTKGPATVKYGPNTTAGAIHLFSTTIPEQTRAHGELSVSDLGRSKAHLWAGSRKDMGKASLGFLVETHQDHADGFKELDQIGGGQINARMANTGFDIEDYVVKLGVRSLDGGHSLEFKYQHKDEVSNETYLGLSQSDYDAQPNRRYRASALDKMVNDHDTFQLTHGLSFGEDWALTTVAYRTEFARNWHKLDRFKNATLSGLSQCSKLDSILRNEFLCAAEMAVLQGQAGLTSADDVLQIRANNRSYYAQGVQTGLAGEFDLGGAKHNLTLSVRYHEDGVDRFQDQDGYKMDNGLLVLTTDNAPGTQANRLSEAKALSAYVEDRAEFGALAVTAGLRVESVDSQQERWSTPDRGPAPSSVRENSYTELLPALSASYDISDSVSVLAGVHRGFAAAPVSSRESTTPEESTVYEGGFRVRTQNGLHIDAVAFFNDYSNLLGRCTNSSGGGDNCDIGDAFNGGNVDVKGLELSASYTAKKGAYAFPLSASYSYTDSAFKHDFSNSFWGTVERGDALPYVAKHQFSAQAGIESETWGANAVLSHISDRRNVAGQGDIAAAELIGGHTLVDIAAHYTVSETVTLKLKVENLLDTGYLASRRPYGLRPGKPREVFASLMLDF